MRNARYILAVGFAMLLAGNVPPATTGTVSGTIKVLKRGKPVDAQTANAWVYLEDLGKRPELRPGKDVTETITQKSIQFSPRVVVIPVHATIRFPNKDPIEHNVFSPPIDTRILGFDLKRYGPSERGKSWKFLQPGEFVIYCDIHKDMSATVKVVPTRYFARVAADGTFAIPNVPPGTYRLNAWAPASLDVKSPAFEVTTNQNAQVTMLNLQLGELPVTHLNKTGDPYYSYSQ